MDQAEFLEALKRDIHDAHDVELARKDGEHVHMVYDDGEVVFTKGGNLFGMRTFHRATPSLGDVYEDFKAAKLPINWPAQAGEHGRAFVTEDDAFLIADRIWEFFGKDNHFARKRTKAWKTRAQ